MKNLLVRLGVNAAALYVASLVIPGIRLEGLESTLGTALLFGLVNAFIKPLVSLATCPVQIITLGLFTLILNALMLLLTAWLAGLLGIGFQVVGFWSAFWGAITVSVVSFVLSQVIE